MYLWIFKSKSKQQFYFFIYLLLVILVDIIPVHFPKIIGFNRNILFTGYIILSIMYFGIIYHQNISSKIFRIFNVVLIIILVFLNMFQFNIPKMERLNLVPMASLPILFIFESLLWYYHKLKNINEYKITDDFLFWISSGLLIWSVFFIFRAIPMYFLQDNDPNLLSFVIDAFSVVNILTYLLFLIELIFMKKNERSSRRT